MSDEYVVAVRMTDVELPVVHENCSWFWNTTMLVMVPPLTEGTMCEPTTGSITVPMRLSKSTIMFVYDVFVYSGGFSQRMKLGG